MRKGVDTFVVEHNALGREEHGTHEVRVVLHRSITLPDTYEETDKERGARNVNDITDDTYPNIDGDAITSHVARNTLYMTSHVTDKCSKPLGRSYLPFRVCARPTVPATRVQHQ